METLTRKVTPTLNETAFAEIANAARAYVKKARNENPAVGVTRKWNDRDIRAAYIAGRIDAEAPK